MASENTSKLPVDIFRQLFEYAADPIFILDTDGNFVEVNRAACDHVGYSRAELLRMRPEHIDDAASREKIPERMAQIRNERQIAFEAVHVHRDGTHIPVEMHIRWIECGEKTFSLNICRNIAERKQRELEYRAMLETTTDGFWIVRASDARIMEANEAYCKTVGYTRSELLSMHISDLEACESPEETRSHILKIMETGHDLFETKHRHKGGHLIEVEVSVTYSTHRGGVFFSFVRDISARKKAQALLYDSEERFRRMYENARIGIAMAGENQKFFSANPAFCKLFGYTVDELLDLTILDLTHPDYLDQTRQNMRILLDGALSSYSVEKKYLKKGGEAFWGRAIATEVWSSTPGKRYVMGMLEDITGRVEGEERRLVEMRGQKDILVREVHHRIKNNLQGVVGLLRQYAGSHPELADAIDAAAGKVHSIAAIHGLQASTLSEAVNLAPLMEQIIAALNCPVELSDDLPCSVALNRDEAVPIALILNELVTNACKHSSACECLPGCRPITVRLNGDGTRVAVG
jgi:PAS domain S-box-containing protein